MFTSIDELNIPNAIEKFVLEANAKSVVFRPKWIADWLSDTIELFQAESIIEQTNRWIRDGNESLVAIRLRMTGYPIERRDIQVALDLYPNLDYVRFSWMNRDAKPKQFIGEFFDRHTLPIVLEVFDGKKRLGTVEFFRDGSTFVELQNRKICSDDSFISHQTMVEYFLDRGLSLKYNGTILF